MEAQQRDHLFDLGEDVALLAAQSVRERGVAPGLDRIAVAGLAAGKAPAMTIGGAAPRLERFISHARDYAPALATVDKFSP